MKNFDEIVEEVKPSILIGASAAAGSFNENILTKMGEFNERPIIFALSNPTHKVRNFRFIFLYELTNSYNILGGMYS